MRLLLCYPVSDDDVQRIQQAVPDWEVDNAGQERIGEAILSADVFCGHAKVPVPWEEVVKQGRLQWIQSSAAGLDHCLVPSVVDSPIRVTSASGLFANQVGEQTLALLYGLFRKVREFIDAESRREFVRLPTWDLHGKTIGIVGLGGNGRRIAELLQPLGNRIVATDWFPVNRPASVAELWPHDQLERLLTESDVVILCVPLNPQTQHMIDAKAFEAMKPGAVLINVARGPVVEETALVKALDSGKLAAAGLDVTEVEPLPEQSPLWDRMNVIISPHVGAQSARRVPDTTTFFIENVRRYQANEPLLNEVDKQLGFPPRFES